MPQVTVLTANSNIGAATVAALRKEFPDIDVIAAVRSEEKGKAAAEAGAKVAVFTAGDNASIEAAFAGSSGAYIAVPSAENRAELTASLVARAKAAGVQHIVLVSVPHIAAHPDYIFMKQFAAVEQSVRDTGLQFTFLRSTFFQQNWFGQAASIKGADTFYFGLDSPTATTAFVSVNDIGAAAAHALAKPELHANKVYNLTGPEHLDFAGLVAATSAGLGRPIQGVPVTVEQSVKAFEDMGVPAWQAGGIGELLAIYNSGKLDDAAAPGDFEAITGRKGTKMEDFLRSVAGAFAKAE